MDDLAPWYSKIYRRPDSTTSWHRDYTFPGKPRARGSLHTSDKDEAARQVREEWRRLEFQRQQAELLAIGMIRPEQVDGKDDKIEMRLSEALDTYMEKHGNKLPSRITLEGQKQTILELMPENPFLSAIDQSMVKELIEKLERRMVHYVGGDRPMAESTINHHAKMLRAVMRRARSFWRVRCAPHEIVWGGRDGVMLSVPDYERRIVEDEEEERLIREKLATDTRNIYDFLLEAGVRANNAMSLKKAQVKWSLGHIELRVKSFKRDRRTGKSGKLLLVPINERIEGILHAVWGDDPEFVFTYVARKGRTWTHKKTGERKVIRGGQRYPFTWSLLRDRWNEARAALGLGPLTIHGLRATFATRLLDEDVDILTVRDLMGHADIKTTERYAKVRESRKREAMARLAKRAKSRSRHGRAKPPMKVVQSQ